MAGQKYSVDDILSDIEMSRARARNQSSSSKIQSMERIDQVIEEILTQKEEARLTQNQFVLTEEERQELKKEIREQTLTLTREFEKLEQEKIKQAYEESFQKPAPVKSDSKVTEIKKSPPVPAQKRVQKPKTESGREPLAFTKQEAPKEEEDILKKYSTAHSDKPHLRKEDIGGHFGNFQTVSREAPKSKISPLNYREYKNSRTKKIDSFVLKPSLSPQEEQAPPEEEKEFTLEEIQELEQIRKKAPEDSLPKDEELLEEEELLDNFEYTEDSQVQEITDTLKRMRSDIKNRFILLGALAMNAFLLAFVTPEASVLKVLHILPVIPLVYLIINLVLLLFVGGIVLPAFRDVFDSLSRREPNKDMLYLPAFIFTLAMNVALCFQPSELLQTGIHLYTPAIIIMFFLSYTSKYLTIEHTINNFHYISDTNTRFAVTKMKKQELAEEITKGLLAEAPVLVQNTPIKFFENFLFHSFHYDKGDTTARKAAIFAIPLALLSGGAAYFMNANLWMALSIACGVLTMSSGFISAVLVAFPLHDTAAVLGSSGIIPTYDVIEEFSDANAILLNAADLFPPSSIKLHGIKTFQGKRVDDAIVDAASVLCLAQSALQHVFLGILNDRSELLEEVDSLQYEDLMGLSAWVSNRRVLIGNRELMVNHSVAVPKAEYETQFRDEGNEIIYLSTGGELCAAFIVSFTMDEKVGDMIRLLDKNRMSAAIYSVDACLTAELLGNIFEVSEEMFKILPSRLHGVYEQELKPKEREDSLLGNDGSLFGGIISLVASKKLFRCIRFGSVFYLASAGFGLLLLLVMLFTGNTAGFSCLHMILYMGLFAAVYWLYEKNMRL